MTVPLQNNDWNHLFTDLQAYLCMTQNQNVDCRTLKPIFGIIQNVRSLQPSSADLNICPSSCSKVACAHPNCHFLSCSFSLKEYESSHCGLALVAIKDASPIPHVYPLRYSAIATHLAREFTGNLGNNCRRLC